MWCLRGIHLTAAYLSLTFKVALAC